MDSLPPIVVSVSGIEISRWKDILIFGLRVFIFSIPFVIVGLIVENDIMRVPFKGKLMKTSLVIFFSTPIFLFAILNYLAPGLRGVFWEKYPFLERLWIMEGTGAPLLLAGLTALYLVSYLTETLRGELVD